MSAGKVQVVERDAEMQLIPWEEQGWQSSRSSRSSSINATRRSNEDLELSGLQDSVLPWHLDRIDQRYPPLDKMYTYANTASNVHIYGMSCCYISTTDPTLSRPLDLICRSDFHG